MPVCGELLISQNPQFATDRFSWARNRADAADPAVKSAAALVAENSSLHEWSYRDR